MRLYLGGAARAPAGLVPDGVSVHPQRGDGLGARMLRAFVETFAAGHPRAAIVGTDHPTLPDAFFGLAFGALAEPMTAVLGALGLRRHWDRLEGDVAYARGRRAGRVAKKRLAEAQRLAREWKPKKELTP